MEKEPTLKYKKPKIEKKSLESLSGDDAKKLSDNLAKLKNEENQERGKKIEAARQKITETALKNPEFNIFLEHIPAEILSKLKNTPHLFELLSQTKRDFLDNPEFGQNFKEIILNDNFDLLRKKSEQQLKKLSALYFDKFNPLKPGEYLNKRNKLKSFIQFTDSLMPIRGDKHKPQDEYKAPRLTNSISSYGEQDVIVQADKYVYGSFDQIRHQMTGHDENFITRLDEDDIKNRTQICMIDIANTSMRFKDKWLQGYLNNVFDYQTGKKILAYYCASVFDDVEQAKKFLKREASSHSAQHWPEIPDQQIIDKMKKIAAATGIEPPLSLELRIKNSAKIQK